MLTYLTAYCCTKHNGVTHIRIVLHVVSNDIISAAKIKHFVAVTMELLLICRYVVYNDI